MSESNTFLVTLNFSKLFRFVDHQQSNHVTVSSQYCNMYIIQKLLTLTLFGSSYLILFQIAKVISEIIINPRRMCERVTVVCLSGL